MIKPRIGPLPPRIGHAPGRRRGEGGGRKLKRGPTPRPVPFSFAGFFPVERNFGRMMPAPLVLWSSKINSLRMRTQA